MALQYNRSEKLMATFIFMRMTKLSQFIIHL